jgi:hypothetical protein
MAYDLIFKNSSRHWGRGAIPSSSGQEGAGQSRSGTGWFGYTMAAMFATRILSGKWPWYWFNLAGKRIERK